MAISLLIDMKMPTKVGIFIFISRENFMLSSVEYENSFITLGHVRWFNPICCCINESLQNIKSGGKLLVPFAIKGIQKIMDAVAYQYIDPKFYHFRRK